MVLLLEVEDGAQQRFLEAYEQMCQQVAAVPGHVSDQLCQSIENPSQWLITSEWESALPFLAWVDSPAHLEMVRAAARLRARHPFAAVRRAAGDRQQRGRPSAAAAAGTRRGWATASSGTPSPSPSSRAASRRSPTILADYTSPEARVDDTTRLRRTSLFMHGNRVVRAVEVEGDLVKALRHVAAQPEVRAVEEAINPYLEQDRDLGDPRSARDFFARAALPAVHHVAMRRTGSGRLIRHALYYPVEAGLRPGGGPAARAAWTRQHRDDPAGPVAGSTIFLRDDIVVRLVDLRVPIGEAPAAAAGLDDPERAAALATMLDLGDGRRPARPSGVSNGSSPAATCGWSPTGAHPRRLNHVPARRARPIPRARPTAPAGGADHDRDPSVHPAHRGPG